MKKLIAVCTLFLIGISQAQVKTDLTSYFLANVGYSNLNGNYFKVGPEVYFVQPSGNIIDLSATANMAYFKNKFVVIPEVGLGYLFNSKDPYSKANPYSEYLNATFYSARVNASPWNITPEIGITIIGLLEFNVGYSFEYREHEFTSFDGLKLGLTFHIPTQIF